MRNILVEQRNPQGVLKTWRLRASAQKPGQKSIFGSSKHADLRSADLTVHGIQGIFEWQQDHWVYLNMVLSSDSESLPVSLDLRKTEELKLGATVLKVTPYADKSNLLASMESLPQLTAAELAKADTQVFLVTCKGKILETKTIGIGTTFISKYDSTKQKLEATRSAEWMNCNIGNLEIYQRSISSNKVQFRTLSKDEFLAKDGRGPVFATLIGAVILAAMFTLSPSSRDAGEVAKDLALPASYHEMKIAPLKKKTPSNVAKAAPIPAGEAAAANAAAPTNRLQTIKALGSTSRLSSLIGKISATAARSANIVIANGISADSPSPTGRALANIGKDQSGKDWGSEGKGQQVSVSTLGAAGGHGTGKMGQLNTSKTGTGGAELLEDESEIIGGLDREVIAQYIRTQIGQILYCYERQLSASPDLYGKVAVRFTIGSKGEVETQRIGDSTLRNAAVEGCILQRVARWKFPAPEGGTKVNVTYPFLFKSTN